MEKILKKYQKHLQKRAYRPSTVAGYVLAARQLLVKLPENYDSDDMQAILEESDLWHDLKPSSYNFKLKTLSTFFEFLRRENIITYVPEIQYLQKKMDRPYKKRLTKEQIGLWLDTVREISVGHQYIAALLMAGAGMRISEVRDFEIPTDIDVSDTGQVFVIIPSSKSRTPRRVPVFDKPLATALKSLKSRHRGDIPQKLGIYRSSFSYATDKTEEVHGIRITPHDLRIFYATQLYLQKIDLVTIQRLLGHRSIDTTLLYIAQVMEEEEYKKAAESVELLPKPTKSND